MKSLLTVIGLLAAPLVAQAQIGGGNCNAAMLSGNYALVLSGRSISSTNAVKGYSVSNGVATFDGIGKVTLTVTADTNQAVQQQIKYTGTYVVPANCSGTISITGGGAISFVLGVWNAGANFSVIGEDNSYAYTGNGTPQPAACATATLSGAYGYSATGFSVAAGGAITGAMDEAGLLQFDGQGAATYSYTLSSPGTPTQLTATGTYTLTSACVGTVSLTDSNGKTIAANLAVTNAAGTAVSLIEASSTFVRTGTAHSTFLNPAQSVGNVSSYAVDSTPPGSVFVIFGSNLATKPAGATTATLPTTLLNTSVLVNGTAAPLFYVDQNQIDVQMPWDTPGGALATVVVKNGTASSNAAAVFVPATGTPGLSVYGNNRAVVVNQSGSVNSGSAPANVGDDAVAYFTGGGPVMAAGKLVSGSAAPAGLSPVTGANTVTLNGVSAKVIYMGLTPGSIGLYQVNFVVPTVAKGTYPLVITIAGQASNNPVMTVN
jgi:uncharacterized protein (TIGR03437 family)